MRYGFTVTKDMAGDDYRQFLQIASERISTM